jgi:N-methylhydantoinase B
VNRPVEAGDVVRIVTGGGGGYGNPREREPALVAADVLDGFVDAAAARDVYGVAVDPETGEVDEAATARLRT